MWKKVGVISPTSHNDNKSSRSRDQNPIQQPFSQLTKQRMSQSQIFFEPNDYFFSNHFNKNRETDSSKQIQQQNIRFTKLTHARSHKQLPSDYSQADKKRKTLNLKQFQQLTQRFNQDTNQTQNNQPTTVDENIKTLQSTQKFESSTSIENNAKTLKQCRSTPQINLSQARTVNEEIPLHKKVQTKKNLQLLKKQHSQIKKAVESQLSDFNNPLYSMKTEISNHFSQMAQNKAQNDKLAGQKSQKQQNSLNLRVDQMIPETKNFVDKFKNLNLRKSQLIEKYKSFRVK